LAGGRRPLTVCRRQCCLGEVGEGLPSGTGEVNKKWVRGLIRRQSGVEWRLYGKGRGAGEVCVKRVLSLGRCFFPFFFCNHALFVLGTKSLMQREL